MAAQRYDVVWVAPGSLSWVLVPAVQACCYTSHASLLGAERM